MIKKKLFFDIYKKKWKNFGLLFKIRLYISDNRQENKNNLEMDEEMMKSREVFFLFLLLVNIFV